MVTRHSLAFHCTFLLVLLVDISMALHFIPTPTTPEQDAFIRDMMLLSKPRTNAEALRMGKPLLRPSSVPRSKSKSSRVKSSLVQVSSSLVDKVGFRGKRNETYLAEWAQRTRIRRQDPPAPSPTPPV